MSTVYMLHAHFIHVLFVFVVCFLNHYNPIDVFTILRTNRLHISLVLRFISRLQCDIYFLLFICFCCVANDDDDDVDDVVATTESFCFFNFQ